MEEKEWVKKLLSLAETTAKKPPSDLYTAILNRMNRKRSQIVTIEYFECLEDLKLIKSAIKILLENGNIKPAKKTVGEKILTTIKTMKTKSLFESPKPVIDSGDTKYKYRDGSSSKFEDYEKVKDTIIETDLFNRITELTDICSDGLAFLGIEKEEFWHREDMIEEITPTLDKEEEKNA